MAKMYKKSDLKFENGYVLTKDDEVVALPFKAAIQLNALETFLQKQEYLAGQPEAQPEPTLDGFERESILKSAVIEVETPALDEREKEGRQILKEIRGTEMAKLANCILENHEEAIRFLHEEKFVEGTEVILVDTPTIGDPLKADPDDVIKRICDAAKIDMA